MLTVAIIDDGVMRESQNNCIKIRHYAVRTNYSVEEEKLENYSKYGTIINMHGTICADILNYYSLNPYELVSIKLIRKNGLADLKSLISALYWVLENKIDLLSLSIGTTHHDDFNEVELIISKIAAKGTIIVAAADNDNLLTVPAGLCNVIGVKSDLSGQLEDNSFAIFEEPIDGINIMAKTNSKFINSNSFVTPFITATILNLLSRGIYNYANIIGELKRISKTINQFSSSEIIINSFHNEKVNIPIACVYGDDLDVQDKYIAALVNYFREEGFNSIGLSREIKTDFCKGLFNIDSLLNEDKFEQYLQIYSSMTQADIIFTSFPCKDDNLLLDFLINNSIDILIDITHKVEKVIKNIFLVQAQTVQDVIEILKNQLINSE